MRARATEEERALVPPSPAPQGHHPRAAADSTAAGMSSSSSPEQLPEAAAPSPPPPPPPPSYQPQRTRGRVTSGERTQPVPGDARPTHPPPRSSEIGARLTSPTSSLEDVVVVSGEEALTAAGGLPVHPRQHARTGSAHRAVFEALARLLPVLLPPPTEEEQEQAEKEEKARGDAGGKLEAAERGAGRMEAAALRCGRQCQGYMRSLQQGIQVRASSA